MALLWYDGFDHYGGLVSNMLAGPWAQVEDEGASGPDPDISTAKARTEIHSLHFGGQAAFHQQVARRLFGANKTVVGVGWGLYMEEIPSLNNRQGLTLRDDANEPVLSFVYQSDASIEVKLGDELGTSIGRTGQVLTAQAWNHVEFKVVRDEEEGSVEIRVNKITRLALSGVNTGAADFAGVQWQQFQQDNNETYVEKYIDDVFAWDDAGSEINDFVGPKRVYLRLPNQDTVVTDFVRNTGATDYAAIDDTTPDGDATYLEATDVGDVSEFGLTPLPDEVTAITAHYMVPMVRKLDAGEANFQTSLISNGEVAAGEDRPITEVYTYWGDVITLDPDTGAPFTLEAANAVLLRMKKTASE